MYRILEFLRNERLVHKLGLANKYVACSHITREHECGASQLLICIRCQKVKKVSAKTSIMRELRSTIEQAGFRLASTEFEINCVCDGCVAD